MPNTELRQHEIIRQCRLAACLVDLSIAEEERTENERWVWMHPYLLLRAERGMHHNLFLKLALEDPNRFRRCLRMDTSTFESLVQKISPHVKKQEKNMSGNIPPAERLSITLRYLATGETQESLRLSFRIGQSTVSTIIRELCSALVLYCHQDPSITIIKKTFNAILMAVVDAHLRFIYVDMGTNGRYTISHPRICLLEMRDFRSVSAYSYDMSMLVISAETGRTEGFSITDYQELGATLKMPLEFRAPMRYDPDATLNTLICCCPHNMLRSLSIASATYTPKSFLDFEDEMAGRIISGEWREELANGLVGIAPQGGNRHRNHAFHPRDRWCRYFNGVRAIPWQERMV